MASSDYHFITHWRVRGTIDEIADIIGNAADLVRWWPSVYLDVRELEPGDADGVGKVIDLYTKGWLPYTLRWKFRVSEVRGGHGMTLEASGDFVGRGIWTFEQDPRGQAAIALSLVPAQANLPGQSSLGDGTR